MTNVMGCADEPLRARFERPIASPSSPDKHPLRRMSPASKLANRAIRVSIVAEPIVSWGLERLVQSANPRLEVVGTCEHLADCLAILKRIGADVVLIDLDG